MGCPACRHQTFPLGKTGGLIEASYSLRYHAIVEEFPLGKTGGLIEASVVCQRCHGSYRRFRWVKPAASLKPGGAPGRFDLRGWFPLGKTGGLIEATRAEGPRHPQTGFRWVKPAASLKLLGRCRGRAHG